MKLTKRNFALGILAVFLAVYFGSFIYSAISPSGMEYQYTHLNIIPSYWLQAMQFINQTKYQYDTSIFLPNSTQIRGEPQTIRTYSINYGYLGVAVASGIVLIIAIYKLIRGD